MEGDSQIIDREEYTEEEEGYTLSNSQRGLIYTALSFTIIVYILNMLGIDPSFSIGDWDIANVLLQGLDIGVGIVIILVFWYPYLKFHRLPASANFAIVLLCLTAVGRIINYTTMSVDSFSELYSMYSVINILNTLLYIIWYVILITNDSQRYHDFKKIKTFAGLSMGSILIPTVFFWLFSSLLGVSEYLYYVPLSIVHLIPTGYLFYLISKIPSQSAPVI